MCSSKVWIPNCLSNTKWSAMKSYTPSSKNRLGVICVHMHLCVCVGVKWLSKKKDAISLQGHEGQTWEWLEGKSDTYTCIYNMYACIIYIRWEFILALFTEQKYVRARQQNR